MLTFQKKPFTSFLDHLRTYFWLKVVPHDLMVQFRDNLPSSIVGKIIRKILYPPPMRPHYDWFKVNFTETHLFFIKETYYTEDFKVKCSWTDLAQAFKKNFPSIEMDGDQYDGIALTMLVNDYFHIKT